MPERRRAARRDLAFVTMRSIKALCRDNLAGIPREMSKFVANHGYLSDVDEVVAVVRSKCRTPADLRKRGIIFFVETEGGDRLTLEGLCDRWWFTYADGTIAELHLERDAQRVLDAIGPASSAWLESVRQRVALGDDVQRRSVDDPQRPWGLYRDALAKELEKRSRLWEVVVPSQDAYEAASRSAAERARAEAMPRRRESTGTASPAPSGPAHPSFA